MHDNDLVGHGHGLDLVMRHIDGGRLQPLVQFLDFRAHGDAQFRIEIGERLIEQEYLRIADNGAAHRHALALAAGQLPGKAVEQVGEAQNFRCRFDALVDLGLGGTFQRQRKGHVVGNGHVRIERIVLEHHGDVALLRRETIDHLSADADFAGGNILQPRQHAQQRGLAAARRPDQNDELAIGDLDINPLDNRMRPE